LVEILQQVSVHSRTLSSLTRITGLKYKDKSVQVAKGHHILSLRVQQRGGDRVGKQKHEKAQEEGR
jgi:hypothetical protein